MQESHLKLSVYVIDGHQLDIRPAPAERPWMQATKERFALRCLPLTIANAHGWEIRCPSGFSATWNGAAGIDAITVVADPGTKSPAVSHFGSGVLTFSVSAIFRSEPGFNLMIQGPVNFPKDAISALSGVLETDWAPYTFTMNWIFTRPNTTIRFEKGEPYCHIYPIERSTIEQITPELRLLSEEPELKRQYEKWEFERSAFNIELKRRGSEAQKQKWQKLYHRGLSPDGGRVNPDHRTRLRLKPFVRSSRYNQSQQRT